MFLQLQHAAFVFSHFSTALKSCNTIFRNNSLIVPLPYILLFLNKCFDSFSLIENIYVCVCVCVYVNLCTYSLSLSYSDSKSLFWDLYSKTNVYQHDFLTFV